MQNSEKGGGSDFEKTNDSVRGIIARIRAVAHPDWSSKDDDLGTLKAALSKCSSELERLSFRYDARCSELSLLKGQYAELEKKFLMRPDAMRRAGEVEITELVRQRHEVARQEAAVEKARIELQREKEGLENGTKELLAARLAELKQEYSEKSEQLGVRSEKLALREKETAETEKHLKERIEAARLAAVEELNAAFSSERQAATGTFQKEKEMLSTEAETWRARAAEAFSRLAEATGRIGDLEKIAEAARSEAAEAGQKARLAEMERAALQRRVEEWEKKGPEIEKWRSELKAREARCQVIEENSGKEAQPYRERAAAAELELSEMKLAAEKWHSKHDEVNAAASELKKKFAALEKAAESSLEAAAGEEQRRRLAEMEKEAFEKRLEEWERKGPELERRRAEASSREESARGEARKMSERIAELEEKLQQSENLAAQVKLRCDKEIPAAEARYRAESSRVAALEKELEKVKDHFGKALSELAETNECLAAEKERFIKAEAQKDSERTRKMEELLAEMAAKERALEESWTRRHRALEAEQKAYQEEFSSRHSALLEELRAGAAGTEKLYAQKEAKLLELNKRFTEGFQDREAKARAVEEELRGRSAALDSAAAALVRDYEEKHAALEGFKRKIMDELAAGGEK